MNEEMELINKKPLHESEAIIKSNENLVGMGLWNIGNELSVIKDTKSYSEKRYNNFEEYAENELGYSKRHANRFIKISREYSGTSMSQMPKLGITKLISLAELPVEEREEFIDNNPVEDMTTRELQEAIKKNKELESQFEVFAEKTSTQIYDLMEENQRLKEQKTKTVEKEVIPEGYITKDNFNKLRQEFREKVDENHELKKQLEATIVTDTKEEHQKKIKHSAITFSNRVHSFINDVGGLGWLIDYLDDLPIYEKEEYIKAVNLLYQWAETIKSNF